MDHFIWSANPVALSFGGIRVFWYGILFALAILSGLKFMQWIYKQEGKDEESLDSLFLYVVIGIVVGARLGHCLFYDPEFYLAHPMKIFAVWEGGLASHGGGVGVLIALYLYTKKYNMNYLWLLDRLAIPTALFGFFVRMGNFMNSEIVGIKTDAPWAIIFTRVDAFPRHPTQLYEAFAYLIIFLFLTLVYKQKQKELKTGFLFGLFLILIFSARFMIEFVKVKQAAYSTDMLITTGQALSIPFLLIGLVLLLWKRKRA
jgi:prolipoprotein diacylglyceryl transferase